MCYKKKRLVYDLANNFKNNNIFKQRYNNLQILKDIDKYEIDTCYLERRHYA